MTEQIQLNLPDRYDMLQRKATGQLSQIITPVESSLAHIDSLHIDMNACSRGAFLILRGDSGTGTVSYTHLTLPTNREV